MSTTKLLSDGTIQRLDGRAEADTIVAEDDCQSPSKLSRLLTGLVADVAALKRKYAPRRIDFEDMTTGTSAAKLQLVHGFGGRVRWTVVGWQTAGTTTWTLKEDTTNTDANTLVLLSYVAGTASIRVEEAG